MIPMFLGAPFIIAALIAIFQAAISFFLKFMTRKFAAIGAAIVLFTALTTTLIIALNLLIEGISYAMPNELVIAIGWFMPTNVMQCVGAYYSAVAAKFIYDMKAKVVRTTFMM